MRDHWIMWHKHFLITIDMRKFYFLSGIAVALGVFLIGSATFASNFGLDETAGAAGLTKYGNSVPTIAGNVIGTLLSMISVLFFVLVLYGGILYMTARGSSETTEKAINTIIAATIGIVIIIGAYALTNFVFKLGSNTGGNNQQTPEQLPALQCLARADYCAPFNQNTCDTDYCVYLDIDADNDGQNEGCVPKVQTACTGLSQQQCSTNLRCGWGTGDNG